jgi:hypothetical protein
MLSRDKKQMPEITSILDACIRSCGEQGAKRLRVLTFPTHERYQSTLSHVDAHFLLWNGPGIKQWNHDFSSVPQNHLLLPYSEVGPAIPPGIVPDLVISQHDIQYKMAMAAANYFSVPLISMEHTLPHPKTTLWPPEGDFNIYITQEQRSLWRGKDTDPIIRNAIDTDLFCLSDKKRKPVCLSVVNDWIRRDQVCGYSYWVNATKNLPTKVVGDTPGLSVAAKNTQELCRFYQESLIFLCTATHSTSPVTLLEAMSAGCCVVANRISATEEAIRHGENGFLVDSPDEMNAIVSRIITNPDYCVSIGQKARASIVKNNGMKRFTDDWNRTLKEAVLSPWWRRLWSKSD